MQENILEVNNLNMHYETIGGEVAAVALQVFDHVREGRRDALRLVQLFAVTQGRLVQCRCVKISVYERLPKISHES